MELRKSKDGPSILTGYAAVFNSPSEIISQSFREVVAPGAFADSLKADDQRCFIEHDPSMVIGRRSAGTLKLKEDDIGLRFECELPDTSYARDLMVSVERGDVTGASFGFQTNDDVWTMRDGMPLRTLRSVTLADISPVSYPAYSQTKVNLRSLDKFKEQSRVEAEQKSLPFLLGLELSLKERE